MFQKLCVSLVALACVTLLPVAAQGQIVNFNFPLDGIQANSGAGTGSPGTGIGIASLDTGTNLFSWNISWSGLTAPASAAHFHGPAAPGFGAGPTIFLGTSSPDIGSQTVSAAWAADILAGLWYVNVHTSNHPGGEIRGQVVPEPLTLSMLGLGSALLIRRRSRTTR